MRYAVAGAVTVGGAVAVLTGSTIDAVAVAGAVTDAVAVSGTFLVGSTIPPVRDRKSVVSRLHKCCPETTLLRK